MLKFKTCIEFYIRIKGNERAITDSVQTQAAPLGVPGIEFVLGVSKQQHINVSQIHK